MRTQADIISMVDNISKEIDKLRGEVAACESYAEAVSDDANDVYNQLRSISVDVSRLAYVAHEGLRAIIRDRNRRHITDNIAKL